MKKIALILSVLLMFSLVACAGGGDESSTFSTDSGNSSAVSSAVSSEASNVSSEASDDASDVSGDESDGRVGGIIPSAWGGSDKADKKIDFRFHFGQASQGSRNRSCFSWNVDVVGPRC